MTGDWSKRSGDTGVSGIPDHSTSWLQSPLAPHSVSTCYTHEMVWVVSGDWSQSTTYDTGGSGIRYSNSTDGGERTLWSFRLFFLKMGGARVYEALRTQCLRRFLVPEFLHRDDDSAAFSGLFKVLKI